MHKYKFITCDITLGSIDHLCQIWGNGNKMIIFGLILSYNSTSVLKRQLSKTTLYTLKYHKNIHITAGVTNKNPEFQQILQIYLFSEIFEDKNLFFGCTCFLLFSNQHSFFIRIDYFDGKKDSRYIVQS